MKPEGENHGFLAFGKNRAIIQNSGCQKSPPQEFSPKAKKIFITFSAACTSKKYFAGRTRPGPLPQKSGCATFLTRRNGAARESPDSSILHVFPPAQAAVSGASTGYAMLGASFDFPKAFTALASCACRSSMASFKIMSLTFIRRVMFPRSFSSSFMEI